MNGARLLDLTRSLRRAGRVATGVDRVELAYLSHFLADDVLTFALVRTALGYVLLDQGGMQAFSDRIEGRVPWGDIDLMSRVPRRRTVFQQKAESDVRRLAVARTLPVRLAKMLAQNLPAGFEYFNVGHSNLTERVLTAVQACGGRICAMVHDVIPLEHPELQRERTVEPFREKMRRVSTFADRVVYNSKDTQMRSEIFMREWGRCPPAVVSHLGTMMPHADTSLLPDGLPTERPYFVVVGTIEPRKNHSFLLDVWRQLGPKAPALFICGNRGWNNDAVFARLDNLQAEDNVIELPELSDAAMGALVKGAAGSLFPSLSEGYGFPPLEALALGSRVLCNDLPVLREVLGTNADFAPVSDRDLWITTINNWEKTPPNAQKVINFAGPTWADHFKTVLRLR